MGALGEAEAGPYEGRTIKQAMSKRGTWRAGLALLALADGQEERDVWEELAERKDILETESSSEDSDSESEDSESESVLATRSRKWTLVLPRGEACLGAAARLERTEWTVARRLLRVIIEEDMMSMLMLW
jgi:hypothetical protein